MICYLGIGSNIEDRILNLNQSINLITEDIAIDFLEVSDFYESPPMYNLDLNEFLKLLIFSTNLLLE